MSGPSQYVREKREEAARRRLELAKLLRDDPKTTNIELAKALGVKPRRHRTRPEGNHDRDDQKHTYSNRVDEGRDGVKACGTRGRG